MLKRRRCFCKFWRGDNCSPGIFCKGFCVLFGLLSLHHFFLSGYGTKLFCTLWSLTSYKVNLLLVHKWKSLWLELISLKLIVLRSAGPQPLTHTLAFWRKPMVILPEQTDWSLIPRFLNLRPVHPEWVHTGTQCKGRVLVNYSAPAHFFTKMISNVHSSKVYLSHAEHISIYPEIPWYKHKH